MLLTWISRHVLASALSVLIVVTKSAKGLKNHLKSSAHDTFLITTHPDLFLWLRHWPFRTKPFHHWALNEIEMALWTFFVILPSIFVLWLYVYHSNPYHVSVQRLLAWMTFPCESEWTCWCSDTATNKHNSTIPVYKYCSQAFGFHHITTRSVFVKILVMTCCIG